jgi:hypothetical protein
VFIAEPDSGGPDYGCDPWTQNCPPGQKCMPWANDGGTSWNATRCTALAPDPVGVGEPCNVVDSRVSGVDDCEAGAMCWNVDPQTDVGTCVAMCIGSEGDADCADPCSTCIQSGSGVLNLCLCACDPLAQDCGQGRACYPLRDSYICAPDAGGDEGAPGEPCEFLNVCDPGSYCAPAAMVPACEGANGCCTRFCDVADPDACADEPPGVECIPLDSPRLPSCVPPNIGGCLLPS